VDKIKDFILIFICILSDKNFVSFKTIFPVIKLNQSLMEIKDG